MDNKLIILKKFFIFIALMFLLDFSLGLLLKKYYFLQKSGWDYRTTYVIDSLKSGVLILGSSRASHHYSPDIIEDSLKVSTYNGGRDGCGIFYYYGLLKSALRRYRPNIVVLDLRPFEFEKGQDDYDRLNILLPYFDANPELRPICLLRSKFERYKLFSRIYPYNSKLLSLMTTAFDLKRKINESRIKGYLIGDHKYNGPKPSEIFKNDLDTLKVAYFKKFIADCNLAKVKLIVCISPIYVRNPNNSSSIDVARKLCLAKGVPIYDYSKDPAYDNPKLFVDKYHLNRAGSTMFTKTFVSHMRAVLSSENIPPPAAKVAVKPIIAPAKNIRLHM